MKTLIYTAAHGGFDLNRVPLGGAAAVCAALTHVWAQNPHFALRLLTPQLLKHDAPRDKELVRYSEVRYARFCVEFEHAITEDILRYEPDDVVVLSNDISEGPNFQLLAQKGYPLYTLYHVDVVDYFVRFYLQGALAPQRLTAWYDRIGQSWLRFLLPSVLKLVFQKQQDSLFYSRAVIVPSSRMKSVLLRCYPKTPPERIRVLPWGSAKPDHEDTAVQQRVEALRKSYAIPETACVLITLSRIAPEKGQDLLLQALAKWERKADYPPEGVWVLICGEPAYMRGPRFLRRLHRLARRLTKTRVLFPGYLAGLDKQAHFRLADLYVFPSRHESYGLTLLEAFLAGLPALSCHHYGAEELMQPDFGQLLPPAAEHQVPDLLAEALGKLFKNPKELPRMGEKARAFADARPFSETAKTLAGYLISPLAGAIQPT